MVKSIEKSTGIAEQLAPIRFDERDELSLSAVREALWLRAGQRSSIDVLVQCIRIATEAAAKSPAIAEKFRRDSEGVTASGRLRPIRLLPTERLALERLRTLFGCRNNAEAMRLVIRVAENVVTRPVKSGSKP